MNASNELTTTVAAAIAVTLAEPARRKTHSRPQVVYKVKKCNSECMEAEH